MVAEPDRKGSALIRLRANRQAEEAIPRRDAVVGTEVLATTGGARTDRAERRAVVVLAGVIALDTVHKGPSSEA
jgi:hypothetical protein